MSKSIQSSIAFKIREERQRRGDNLSESERLKRLHFRISYEEGKTVKKVKHSNEAIAYQPNKVSVQFEVFNPKKQHRLIDKLDRLDYKTLDYKQILSTSKEKYYQKIEQQHQKKRDRSQAPSFGLSIKQAEKCNQLQKVKRPSFYDNLGTKSYLESKMELTRRINREKKTYFLKHHSDFAKNYEGTPTEQRRSHKAKLQRMLNSMEIILNSHGCYLSTPNTAKLHYFVGRGNNKNLVISIMKKRWWWQETDDIATANLVWTQLKHSDTLARGNKYPQDTQIRLFTDLISSDLSNANCRKHLRLFHAEFSSRFYERLPENEKITRLRCFAAPEVVHNHFNANYMIGNKNALFQNLSAYFEYKAENVFEVIPLTFFVENVQSRSFREFEKKAKSFKHPVWIVKPGENSNRGHGIFVSKSLAEIKMNLSKRKEHTFIIQKYVTNLMLFHRRKFDIRTYLLAICVGGIHKFYWYAEGYLRTSSEPYSLDDLSDVFTHLTNDAIQVNAESYGKYEPGNKVTYSEFQRYLDSQFPEKKYEMGNLVQEMKGIARKAVQATYFKIDTAGQEYGFELFGLDFLVDGRFKPLLLEINTNPCLELSSPVLQRLIPRMMENLMRITVDPVYRPNEEAPKTLSYFIYEDSLESNRFELIFDELFDRDFEWESRKQEAKVYSEEDNEFEGDGELITIDF